MFATFLAMLAVRAPTTIQHAFLNIITAKPERDLFPSKWIARNVNAMAAQSTPAYCSASRSCMIADQTHSMDAGIIAANRSDRRLWTPATYRRTCRGPEFGIERQAEEHRAVTDRRSIRDFTLTVRTGSTGIAPGGSGTGNDEIRRNPEARCPRPPAENLDHSVVDNGQFALSEMREPFPSLWQTLCSSALLSAWSRVSTSTCRLHSAACVSAGSRPGCWATRQYTITMKKEADVSTCQRDQVLR